MGEAMRSPEEMAEINKSRILADAEALEDNYVKVEGGDFVNTGADIDAEGKMTFSESQKVEAKKLMQAELGEIGPLVKSWRELLEKFDGANRIPGDEFGKPSGRPEAGSDLDVYGPDNQGRISIRDTGEMIVSYPKGADVPLNDSMLILFDRRLSNEEFWIKEKNATRHDVALVKSVRQAVIEVEEEIKRRRKRGGDGTAGLQIPKKG